MTRPVPGNDGEPVPPGTRIFRVGKHIDVNAVTLEERRPLESFFQPSSNDIRLSTWVEELTVADQAWGFLRGNRPAYNVVACLNTDGIRAISPPAGFQPLDVVWEPATIEENGQQIPNTRP